MDTSLRITRNFNKIHSVAHNMLPSVWSAVGGDYNTYYVNQWLKAAMEGEQSNMACLIKHNKLTN